MPALTVRVVLRKLGALYRPPRSFLRHRNPFELLIATILSAQCTDVLVNRITVPLFRKYCKPVDYLRVPPAALAEDIRSVTFANVKAKHIQGVCRLLIDRHRGHVPKTMEELVQLPGVGRKTAAIVLYTAFGKIEGIPVDTHVLRLTQRLGLSSHSDPKRVELDLMRSTPQSDWGRLNPLLVSHGRAVCTARNRRCAECLFIKDCPSSSVFNRRDRAKKI